jgi:transposase
LEQQVAILTQQVDWLKRQLFGKKSEKLDHPELFGSAEQEPGKDESSGDADAPAGDDASGNGPKAKAKKKRAIREKRIPDNVPVREEVDIPAAVQAEPWRWRSCGEEVLTQLEKEPPYYYRRRIVRPKFVLIDDPLQAPIIAPPRPAMIEGGFFGPGLLAEILCDKYLYHIPFYRQHVREKQRFGIDLSQSTMSDAAEKVADQCAILVTRMKELMLESGYVRADETFIRYLDRMEAGGSSTGFFWVYRGMNRDVIFDWQTSREHHHAEDWLGPDYEGYLQGDAYEAYLNYCKAQALRGKSVIKVACMAHIRRKFENAESERPALARWVLRQIAHLYRIEAPLREHGASAEVRARVRQNQSRPLMNLLRKAFTYLLTRRILPKSPFGKALSYALKQWAAMEHYLDDGRIEIDNNDTENDIRPSAVGKKNWLFVGSPEAGKRGAVLYTLLISARNHGVDPQAYLRDVIERLPSAKSNAVDEFLPANWAAAHRDKSPLILPERAVA